MRRKQVGTVVDVPVTRGRAAGTTERLWRWYLAATLLSGAGYFVLPRAGVGQAVVYTALTLACALALLAGVRLHRPVNPQPWVVLAAGMLFYAAADVFWFDEPPFPSVADVLFLSAYALLVVGFVLLARVRSGFRAAVLDALIIATGLGAPAWVFLISPNLDAESLTTLGRAVAVGYPALDLLLLGACALLLLTGGPARPAIRLLGLGVAGQLAADIPYSLSVLEGTFRFGAAFFAGWFVLFACVGAAALHPSAVALGEPVSPHEDDPQGSDRRLAVLAVVALCAPVTLAVRAATGHADPETTLVTAALSAVLFGLVLVRARDLLRNLDEQRRLQQHKDEFVSIVSHELRTPLTSIRGSLGLLAGGVLAQSPAKAERMLQIALENTDRLVRLINDVLDIERMASGRIAVERRRCDAGDLLRQAADAMQGAASLAGVRLEVGTGRRAVWADPDRLQQTLTNLLSNAVTFSPAGGTVWLDCAPHDGHVRFRVRDEGGGIPAEMLESIFEPFRQVDSSDSREQGGTGLGLAICRSIVEQHGGRIWAESTAGQGSTFLFTLPGVAVEPAAPPTSGATAPRIPVCDDDAGERDLISAMLGQGGCTTIVAASGYEALGRVAAPTLVGGLEGALAGPREVKLVLIAEDDPDLSAVLVALCERHGLQTVHASSGAEAIELTRDLPPDLLILDVGLPEGNGFWVADWLRQHERLHSMPIIVYTGRDLDAADRERLDTGNTRFMTKGAAGAEQFEREMAALIDALVPAVGHAR